uniref:GRF-type domain-containing protein n=1 Tax=Lactuca sativa TaxID=4236 RepID=A0A9R1VJY9_LACSA|nr:hypothetical protein LSAT_V11C500229660 [Lactuca sativa]
MSSSSSTSRNQLQVTHVQSQEGVKVCDCVVPAKERTCWKITNPGRRFWNCQNSMGGPDSLDFDKLTRLRKCNFFEWKDEERTDGYYKNLLYSLKQKLDAKDELSEINKLRRRIAEGLLKWRFCCHRSNIRWQRVRKKFMMQGRQYAGTI